MIINMRSIVSLIFFLAAMNMSYSQLDSVTIEFEGEIEFPSQFLQLKSSIASRIDNRSDEYLYSANLSFGLGIYNISDPSDIKILLEIEIGSFEELSVSTLQQIGNYLFVGLGDFQKENPASGLAIIDVTTPENPIIQDIWVSEDFIFGVSHLDVYDGIVYLSVMDDGLLILDAQDVTDIKFVSNFVPDLAYPAVSDGHHQGRGITKVGDILFYAFDRGGLRAIDVSDISQPEEIQKYINPDLINKAVAAYNDVVVIDNYAYVSVDYCGLEVIDISTDPWTLVEWYDPVDCAGFNWFGAEIHTNELVSACNDSLLFVSGGNSEVVVFDISDPLNPERIGGFFELDNELAAYGLHVQGNKISVSYINNPLNIPYIGNWGGLKVLSFSKLKPTSSNDIENTHSISLYPNPVDSYLRLENFTGLTSLSIFSMNGAHLKDYRFSEIENGQIDVSYLNIGTYLLKYRLNSFTYTQKIVKF